MATVNKFKQLDISALRSDYTKGWLVARNPLRVLNHLEQLKKYIQVAEFLYLSTECDDKNILEINIEILKKHQKKEIDTDTAINLIYSTIKNKRKNLSKTKIKELLISIFPVAQIEFHPTDLCNLACRGCTYGHDRKAKEKENVFFYRNLEKLKGFKPQSIVIVGGGEPTLYKDENREFNDLTEYLEHIFPGTRFGLITNGTYFPGVSGLHAFDWVRVSIDAASPYMYQFFRGKNFFDKVCHNLLCFLATPVKYVGCGFLFSKINISEYVTSIRFFYELVKDLDHQYLNKFNMQFRPLRQDPKDEGRPFPEAISVNDIRCVLRELVKLAATNEEIFNFIKMQTNAEIVEKGNTHHPLDFLTCHYTLIFNILRANGDIYPCFITTDQREFCLGNILTDPPETISLNKLLIACKNGLICNPLQCRQCHINHIIEEGIRGNLMPLDSIEVQKNPFF